MAQLVELDRLRAENARLGQIQADAEELAALRKQQGELQRLRGQVGLLAGQLRAATNSAQVAGAVTNAATGPKKVGLGQQVLLENLSDAGQASPEAALETLLWATQKNPDRLSELIYLPEEVKRNPEAAKSLVAEVTKQLNAPQQGVIGLRLHRMQYYGAYGVENKDGTSTIYKDVAELNYGVVGAKARPEDEFTYPNTLRFSLLDGKWRLLLVN
jgi:hypothetical protein